MNRFGIAVVLLAACAANIQPEPVPDQRVINVTIAAWDDAGRPYPKECFDTRNTIEIQAYPTVQIEADHLCHPDPVGVVVGCFYGYAPPLIIVSNDPYIRADTLAHEALHWLLWCSTGDGDGDHSDSDVWGVIYWNAVASLPQ